jgi:hypothetical protein
VRAAELDGSPWSLDSRHRTIATLMIYIDQHDREQTQRSLADLVAGTL